VEMITSFAGLKSVEFGILLVSGVALFMQMHYISA